MAELIIMSHALTKAQKQGIFPGNDELDSALIVPDHFKAAACAITLSANFKPAILTAQKLGLEAKVDFNLPVFDYGSFRGRALKQLAKDEAENLQKWLNDPYSSPHGGTSFQDIYDKTALWLEDFSGFSQSTLVITDPNFLRMVMLVVLQAPISSFANLDIAPLSTLTLSRRHKNWIVCLGG